MYKSSGLAGKNQHREMSDKQEKNAEIETLVIPRNGYWIKGL